VGFKLGVLVGVGIAMFVMCLLAALGFAALGTYIDRNREGIDELYRLTHSESYAALERGLDEVSSFMKALASRIATVTFLRKYALELYNYSATISDAASKLDSVKQLSEDLEELSPEMAFSSANLFLTLSFAGAILAIAGGVAEAISRRRAKKRTAQA